MMRGPLKTIPRNMVGKQSAALSDTMPPMECATMKSGSPDPYCFCTRCQGNNVMTSEIFSTKKIGKKFAILTQITHNEEKAEYNIGFHEHLQIFFHRKLAKTAKNS
jgi:hypothetical protein